MSKVHNSVTKAFESVYFECVKYGEDRSGTKALFDVAFYVRDPTLNTVHTPWRNYKTSYGEHEMDWYDSQDRSPAIIGQAAGIWARMGKTLNSNYGWQLHRNGQFSKIVNLLAADKHTRRAVMTVYNGREVDDYAEDTPCLLNLGFNIINNDLNMRVHFRSNDIVYGFCNDFYTLSQYMFRVLRLLKYKVYPELRLGYIYWIADDMHVYKKHWDMHEKGYPDMTHG